jgi:long-chain acyl-CoA synthetase
MTAAIATAMDSQILTRLLSDLASHGDKPALVEFTRDNVRTMSFPDLSVQIRQLAHGLCRDESGRNHHIAVMVPMSREWIIAALGTIGAGRVLVPLDVQLSDEVLEKVLDDSEADLIFTTTTQSQRLERLGVLDDREVGLLDAADEDERSWQRFFAEPDGDLPQPQTDDTAILFYTSGTTGPPKGVPLTHANIVFELHALRDANFVIEHDRALLPLPGHHVYPLIVGILTPLFLGTPIVLPLSPTGPQIQRALREGEATIVVGVPRLYEAFLTGIESQAATRGKIISAAYRSALFLVSHLPRGAACRLGGWLFQPLHDKVGPKLRVLASGGAALDPQLARRLEALGWQIAVGYGLTETSPLVTINPPGGGKLDSVGRAVPDVEIRIDIPARSNESNAKADGARGEGEILVRGPNVFAGYYNLPDKTAEALGDDGWFRTGDLGYLDEDGYLYVTGRVNTLMKTKSGKRLQPDEVEEAYAAHSAIREIGVLEIEGELVAVVVPAADIVGQSKNRSDDLAEALRPAIKQQSAKIPSYQRLSDFVVSQESLARTRLGKIQRHELAELYKRIRSGNVKPAKAKPVSIEEMSADDRTLLEDPAVQQTWGFLAEKYSNERLTPDTHLQLDLGIDSMEWLNLSIEIRERADIELGNEAIGRVESVRDLLREVSAGQAAGGAAEDFLDDPEQVLTDSQKRYLEPHDKFRAVLARSGFAVNRRVLSLIFGLEVKGADHLPDKQFIITPNHSSYLDSFALAAALDWARLERTYWGGFTGTSFNNPLTRTVSRLAKVVPVDPQRGVIAGLAVAAAVLDRGHNLIWYPEGGLSRDGKLQEFKPGIGLLLTHYPVSIVPAWIDGTFEALPVGKMMPRLRKLTVAFGEPVGAHELLGKPTAAEKNDYSKQQKHYVRIAKKLQKHVARFADQGAR